MSDFDRDTGEIIPPEPYSPPAVAVMRPLASAETTEVCTALSKAQGEFEAPKRTKSATIRPRDGGQGYQYAYAPLEEIIRVVQKPMAAAGLSRQQYLVSRGNMWFVRTIIWHVSGQWISSDYPVFAEAMTAQKFASGVTYAKRQGLCLAVGLAPEDDDDAQTADAKPAEHAAPQRATRANPAVAAADAGKDRAREAFKRVREAIDKAPNPHSLYDAGDIGEEWAPDLRDDVQLIAATQPAAMDLLHARLRERLNSAAR